MSNVQPNECKPSIKWFGSTSLGSTDERRWFGFEEKRSGHAASSEYISTTE